MSDVRELEEVKFVVENVTEKYGWDWRPLMEEVESISRTNEAEHVATAKLHLVVKDCDVIGWGAFYSSIYGFQNLWKVTATHASEVGSCAFRGCVNLNEAILPSVNSVGDQSFHSCSKLTNVRLPNATSIGGWAFAGCFGLRHITVHPNVNIAESVFYESLSLEILATCAGFELDTEDKDENGDFDPTVGITRYLKSQCELDRQQRDVFLTYNLMLKLCNHHIDKNTGVIRATPGDHLAIFLINNEDIASHMLSFFGMKWGENDIRNASKQRLLELGLQKKVLREVNNLENRWYWGVCVDEEGRVVSRKGDAN